MIPAEERRKVPPKIQIRKNFLSTVLVMHQRGMKTLSHCIFERGIETEEDSEQGTAALYRRIRGNVKKAKSQKVSTRTPDLLPGHIRTRPGYA
jgi:hypothetical protein